jgi:hypothetical protein
VSRARALPRFRQLCVIVREQQHPEPSEWAARTIARLIQLGFGYEKEQINRAMRAVAFRISQEKAGEVTA